MGLLRLQCGRNNPISIWSVPYFASSASVTCLYGRNLSIPWYRVIWLSTIFLTTTSCVCQPSLIRLMSTRSKSCESSSLSVFCFSKKLR